MFKTIPLLLLTITVHCQVENSTSAALQECSGEEECPKGPCQSPCGPNSKCRINFFSSNPICSCLEGFQGAPPNCRPANCLNHSDCHSTLACINKKCSDSCKNTCGINAQCKVHTHSPICYCGPGTNGDPFSQCYNVNDTCEINKGNCLEDIISTKQQDACTPSPCGPNSKCTELNGKPICKCLENYVGQPPVCRDACETSCDSNGTCTMLDALRCPCNEGYQRDRFGVCRFTESRMGGSVQNGACVVPPPPANGNFEIMDIPLEWPGQKVQFLVLKVSCAKGYGMVELGNNQNNNGSQEVICIAGNWTQTINKCVRFCKLNPDPSVTYKCSGKVCKSYVAPGTLVDPVCNTYYTSESLLYMKCVAGTWNHVARCKPVCGRLTPKGAPLIIGGKPAIRGELPWHVGVYRKNMTNYYQQICGGSLVASRVVISAAHCFWSDARMWLPPSRFAVAIGKLYRSWDDERDNADDVQKSEVQEIRAPALFQGAAASFQEDIAVLILVNEFVFKTYVAPVCLSFDAMFDIFQLQDGNLGKVSGWGLTAANGAASDVLNTVQLPFVNEKTCVNTLPQSFRPFITGDKFCAGYTDGIALCHGDSGGGIVFPDMEHGVDQYYLRGVVSTAPNIEDQLCNDHTYTTFTRVIEHEILIKNALVDGNARSCPLGMFQCDNGICQDQETDCQQEPVTDEVPPSWIFKNPMWFKSGTFSF